MSSSRRPWYPWYPKDFVVDEKVQALSPLAELLYRRALDVMWQANTCQLPNNSQKLANQIGKGLSQQQFESAWSEIQFEGFELFKTTEDGLWIYSKRLLIEAEKIENIQEKRRELGQKGGLAKATAIAKAKAQANAKQNDSHTDTYTEKDKDLSSSGDEVEDIQKDGVDFLITHKKRKLNGKRFQSFTLFWDAFDYKQGKREAADAWYDIPQLTESLVAQIVQAAKAEAANRKELIAKGKTPKMAQGWISGRRWEDEQLPEVRKPIAVGVC